MITIRRRLPFWAGASFLFLLKYDSLLLIMNCLFWAEGSAQIGLGHLFRAATLARALKERRGASSILLSGAADDALSPVRDAFDSMQEMHQGLSHESAFQLLVDLIQRNRTSLLIMDRPRYPDGLCHLLKQFEREHHHPAVVAFGAAEMPTDCVDMIIDANRDKADAGKFDGSITAALFGPQYAALAPDFAKARKRFSIRDSFERLVISMGGSDPNLVTLVAYQVAVRLEDLMIDIVLGPAFSDDNWRRLEPYIDETRTTIHRSVDHKELADIFSRADGCIVSGGITMFEAAAVGLPTIVISQNEPQLSNAMRLASHGAMIDAGLFSQTSAEDIASMLANWQSSRDLRIELSRRGSETVDGKGLERICAGILGLLAV